MNLMLLFLCSTAAAFGLVAHTTGSWGAGVWAMVLSPVAGLACLYDAHTTRTAGGGMA